jgi:alpha-aminoadipic semialdehyde synthase
MLRKLYRTKPDFRLSVIGDLTCDIRGTIEITRRVTTASEPAFIYDPVSRKINNNLSHSGIAVMAIDNLPCEFPKESSMEFAEQISDYVYQIAAHGVIDVTNHKFNQAVLNKNKLFYNSHKDMVTYKDKELYFKEEIL